MSEERDQVIEKVLAASREILETGAGRDALTAALDEYAVVSVREQYQAQQDQEQVSTNLDEPRP